MRLSLLPSTAVVAFLHGLLPKVDVTEFHSKAARDRNVAGDLVWKKDVKEANKLFSP